MRVWKRKYSFIVFFILLSGLIWRESKAADTWFSIYPLKWTSTVDFRVLQVNLGLKLSAEAIKALHSGITLYWDISTEFLEPRVLLANKVIFLQAERYSLHYDTLFNDYRVRNETLGNIRKFSALADALESLQLRRYQQALFSSQESSMCVAAQVSIKFDIESLPIPLRPVAYFSSAWDLSAYQSLACD